MPYKKVLYKAIRKSLLGKYIVYVAHLATMLILARLFSPELFGVIASIAVFLLFFQLLSEAGLSPAIINLNVLEEDDRNGLFGLTVFLGTVCSVVLYSQNINIAEFYNSPLVATVIPYAALSLFFLVASTVPLAFLLRGQCFYQISIAAFLAELLSMAGSILLLSIINPLEALAMKAVISSSVNFILVYYFSGKTKFGRARIGLKFQAIRPLLSFSLYQFGFNLVNFFSRNLDNLLVGKYLGMSSLGVYDKAYQLMRYPLMLLTAALVPAIQPVVRLYAKDVNKVESLHRDLTLKLSIAGSIVGLIIYMVPELIVRFLLGEQWGEVAPIIKILAISIPIQIILSSSGSFFQAMEKSKLMFKVGLTNALVMVISIVIGVSSGSLIDLSWLLVIALSLNFIFTYYVLYTCVFVENLERFVLNMLPASAVIILMVLVY